MALFVTAETVRVLVKTGLTTPQLEGIIGREETLLASEVGALSASRTETITVTSESVRDAVRLRRTAPSVTATENGVAVTDIRLGADGRTITRLNATGWASGSWLGPLVVTYTPNDSAKVTSWVIELVKARLAETPFESEGIGDYNYDRGTRTYAATFRAAVADILGLRKQPASVRMTTDDSPRPSWVGTVRP